MPETARDFATTTSAWRNREGVLAAALTVVVAAMRVALGMRVAACGTPDACAYLGLAQSLGRGNGFQTSYLFDLQVDKLALPTHGIEYWRPGTSFFLLLGKLFGGVTLHGSIVITVLAGLAMAAAAWAVAMHATGSRKIALGSYALCLVLPALWGSSMTPDSTLFYGLAVAWFLALFTVRRRGLAQDILALGCAGVAYMVRNDAVLLLAPLVVVLWQRRSSKRYAAMMLAGFFLALAPTHWMNWHVLGTAFPAGPSKALYLNFISDLVSYRAPVTLHTLLATGFVRLLKARVRALALIVYRNLALNIGFGLVFLPAIWVARRRANTVFSDFAGGAAFLAAIVAVYALAMPAIGVFSALRSFVALLPMVAVLVVVGIALVAHDARIAKVMTAAVVVAYMVHGLTDDRRYADQLAAEAANLQALSMGLETAGAKRTDAVVMTADPIQFSVGTGFSTVQSPNNGVAAIKGLADEVGVTYLLMDVDHPGAPVDEIEVALQPQRVMMVPGTRSILMVLPAARH